MNSLKNCMFMMLLGCMSMSFTMYDSVQDYLDEVNNPQAQDQTKIGKYKDGWGIVHDYNDTITTAQRDYVQHLMNKGRVDDARNAEKKFQDEHTYYNKHNPAVDKRSRVFYNEDGSLEMVSSGESDMLHKMKANKVQRNKDGSLTAYSEDTKTVKLSRVYGKQGHNPDLKLRAIDGSVIDVGSVYHDSKKDDGKQQQAAIDFAKKKFQATNPENMKQLWEASEQVIQAAPTAQVSVRQRLQMEGKLRKKMPVLDSAPVDLPPPAADEQQAAKILAAKKGKADPGDVAGKAKATKSYDQMSKTEKEQFFKAKVKEELGKVNKTLDEAEKNILVEELMQTRQEAQGLSLQGDFKTEQEEQAFKQFATQMVERLKYIEKTYPRVIDVLKTIRIESEFPEVMDQQRIDMINQIAKEKIEAVNKLQFADSVVKKGMSRLTKINIGLAVGAVVSGVVAVITIALTGHKKKSGHSSVMTKKYKKSSSSNLKHIAKRVSSGMKQKLSTGRLESRYFSY